MSVRFDFPLSGALKRGMPPQALHPLLFFHVGFTRKQVAHLPTEVEVEQWSERVMPRGVRVHM